MAKKWTFSARFVEFDIDRARYRFTGMYRLNERLQLGLEFNPGAREVGPISQLHGQLRNRKSANGQFRNVQRSNWNARWRAKLLLHLCQNCSIKSPALCFPQLFGVQRWLQLPVRSQLLHRQKLGSNANVRWATFAPHAHLSSRRGVQRFPDVGLVQAPRSQPQLAILINNQ